MKHSEEKQKAKEEGLVKVIGIAEGMVKDKDKQIRSINEELIASRQKEHALNERLGEVDQMVYVLTKADNKHKEVEEQLMAELSSVKKKLSGKAIIEANTHSGLGAGISHRLQWAVIGKIADETYPTLKTPTNKDIIFQY